MRLGVSYSNTTEVHVGQEAMSKRLQSYVALAMFEAMVEDFLGFP